MNGIGRDHALVDQIDPVPPAAFHRRITLGKPPDAQAESFALCCFHHENADPPSDPSAHHHLWWRLLLFIERVGRALPKFQSERPRSRGSFRIRRAEAPDGGQDTTKTSTEVPTCSEGSTSAQGPAAGDGTRKTSDSNPSADNHHPTGTRHDNASIPRLRRRPPSSARALRGRHGQALHLRGRLRPHGPRSRRRPHALLGSLLAKSPSEYWKAAVRGPRPS